MPAPDTVETESIVPPEMMMSPTVAFPEEAYPAPIPAPSAPWLEIVPPRIVIVDTLEVPEVPYPDPIPVPY
jgi:hypothetical protein